jgi:calcium-dependent protein kinase
MAACLPMSSLCKALQSTGRSWRYAWSKGLQEVDEAKKEASARVGRLPVEGRYHRLPRRLEDDYELRQDKPLGIGFSGSVILATSRRTGVAYAVKSFSSASLNQSEKDMLAAELGIFLSMDHPHVARLMAVYETGARVSMVMECLEGGELLERLEEKKVFTEGDAAHATWQMLLALSYLHNEGVVHRDLKLENFLYEQRDGRFLKMIDFGFSIFFQKSIDMKDSCGTVFYIAPEVLNGRYQGSSCDMWSLGVVVFALLSGYMPFDGKSDEDIVRAIKSGKYKMHPSRWSHISPTARDFVMRLLRRSPGDRMTAQQALGHPWLARFSERGCVGLDSSSPSSTGSSELLPADDVAGAFLSFARATRFQQACMQMMAWTLPAEERRQLRDTFLEMDASRTGVIRFSELDQLLDERCGMSQLDRRSIREAMEVLDIDHDEEVHYSDFLAVMMALRLRQQDCGAIEEAFRRFDSKGLGYLTEEGLQKTLGEEVCPAELRRTFPLLDIDRDGRIHLDSFAAYLRGALATSSASSTQVGEGVAGCFSKAGA